MVTTTIPSRDSRDTNTPKEGKKKGNRQLPKAKSNKHNKDFSPEHFSRGVHIFCDGASIPNPGVGGWGVVVYRDGIECASSHGGNAETTNNRMELMGLLTAIEMAEAYSDQDHPATIWCDSQYCVEGANVWLKTWKARGWNKKKMESPKRDQGSIKNLELWQAVDRALSNAPVSHISIKWVKGHVGIVGNERADELAEQGRELFVERAENSAGNELDERYRQIMGAM
ncbi:ribonuclease HI [Rhizobium pusense]|nr:ribonuclease HI [Agrobacterium pusense]